ncbi:histidine kinase [Rhodopseudomonas sp. AAP120]|uniref:hybrid sensor histidine kinase/response regulator n=1 Tax=Rhodopseudomonas sp. AAP120 TaxID=1523430 RepID=UPI0006B96C79|nr:ATP-binding protein [Rhodopseudomonas sp. AAP120]KPF94239.1 histidine kinase [Rhodopseudomonas sp. AAP120]
MRLSVRLTLAMTALVLSTVAALGLLAYYNIGHAMVPVGIQRLADQTKARVGGIQALLGTVRNEALAARTFPSHQRIVRAHANGGVDPQDGTPETALRSNLAQIYAGQMTAKAGILRYRFIGAADGGRELVRVDRDSPDHSPRIAAAGELQQVGDATFFRRGMALAEREVDMTWSRAAAASDPMPAPLVSFATPVRTEAGEPFGLIVIDIDMRPTFERIRAALSEDTRSYIVEADGPYLVNLREGRIVPTSAAGRWQDDFPALAAALGDKNGAAAVLTAPDGQRVAAVVGFVQLPGGMRAGVIETVALDTIMAPAKALQSASLIVALVAAAVAVLVSVMLSRSLARPVVQIAAAVSGYTRTGRLALPTGLSGESRILAAAFAQMVDQVEQTSAALRAKSEVLDKTIASMADAVLVIDADGRRVFGNPPANAIFGHFADIGSEKWKREYRRFQPDGVTVMPETDCPARRAAQGESFDNVEIGIRRDGGQLLQLAASARTMQKADGSFGGAVIVYRNVTALKEAERQLRQAQKMQAIGQLTGGVAHDLNNILTVLTGGVEILADGVSDRPALKDVAVMVDQAVARASDLTNGLLSFARKQPLQPRSIDVNALMEETARLLRSTFGGHIDVDFRPTPELRPALADPSQLSSALLNLAINARDAMPGGGRLLLETANVDLDQVYAEQHDEVTPGRYVVLVVTDTGTGIPAAIRDRVFEPFFTTKAVGEGTGLGLSMVYGFVKQSGGHIEIHSQEGTGTAIRLYLPCAPQAGGERIAAAAQAQGGHETILVVEDDVLVRSYVMTDLAALGYTAHAAASAVQAMAMVYDEVEFDLLFTDVMLGGCINGAQLAEELRKYRPNLKVLFTSGYSDNALKQQSAEVQGALLLEKPYRRADLARMLRLALDGPPPP